MIQVAVQVDAKVERRHAGEGLRVPVRKVRSLTAPRSQTGVFHVGALSGNSGATVKAAQTSVGPRWPFNIECHGTDPSHRARRAVAMASSSNSACSRLNRPSGPGRCSAAVTITEFRVGFAASTARAAPTKSGSDVHAWMKRKNARFPTTTRYNPIAQPRSSPAMAPRIIAGSASMDAKAAWPASRPKAWRSAMRRATGRREWINGWFMRRQGWGWAPMSKPKQTWDRARTACGGP